MGWKSDRKRKNYRKLVLESLELFSTMMHNSIQSRTPCIHFVQRGNICLKGCWWWVLSEIGLARCSRWRKSRHCRKRMLVSSSFHERGHIFMGTGKFENKHGVEILVNRSGENESIGQTSSTNVPQQRRSQSTNSVYCWWALNERTEQSRNSRNPTRRAYKFWEEISTLNWGAGLVLDVSVLDVTHSRMETKEEMGT